MRPGASEGQDGCAASNTTLSSTPHPLLANKPSYSDSAVILYYYYYYYLPTEQPDIFMMLAVP